MSRARLVAVLATVLAAAAVISSAGAGTRPASTHRIDLSSMSKIQQYLHSIGVNPRHVVIQRGKHNYAGPRCPGRRWTCTTARRVLQAGGDNKVECTAPGVSSNGATSQTCNITQSGSKNEARCKETSSTTPAFAQDCTIVQSGADNKATVDQDIRQKDRSAQDALQIATVTQSEAVRKNELHVDQKIDQDTHDVVGGAQKQDGHQVLISNQTGVMDSFGNVVVDVDNKVDVHQSQDQKAKGDAALSQDQNTGLTGPADCASGLPSNPNQCVRVFAVSDGGRNDSHIDQDTKQEEKTKASGATQTQGSGTGGTDGAVHLDAMSGVSTNHADQSKHQKQDGGTFKTQIDPTRCCGTTTVLGGPQSKDEIHQTVDQMGDGAFQTAMLIGESVTPDGSCSITHKVKQDGRNGGDSIQISPCPLVVLTTVCTSGDSESETLPGCSSTPVVVCANESEEFNPVTGKCEPFTD